ncbi:S41 family peptidase [Flavobacterium sp. 5]|uniref:S41 family peptidase n=1 Tax=Flavobacterium sp. 5 TaxID=2035199 RepID=UPI000C2C6137|nr:S41 family peptidase [Flavobacterium sp. 5]PKB17852.1 C-terminal processing protease CtpA/Prc [Flavobacterium sp. 5]
MKKNFLFLFLVFTQIIFCQTKLTETQKLAATCKVWGFLKYYHPNVADGSKNWDEQLFEVLPKIEQAQTKEEFSLILENWIDALGEVKKIAPIIPPKDIEYFDKNFDLSWTNNSKLFSKKLSAKLKFIEDNRFQGEQHYVEGQKAGNVNPINENLSDLNFKEKKSRILALFMYWNLIEYFYPYKYIMDQKWDFTLDKMIPQFSEAKNNEEFCNVFEKLTVKLNDSHVTFYAYPNQESIKIKNYFPAKGKIIDEKIIVTEILADSLALAQNIKIGTVITKINDKTIKQIIIENRDLIPASNEPVYLDRLVESVLYGYSDSVKLEFLQDGKYSTKNINWYNYHDSHRNEFKRGARVKKEKFKLLDNNIGYVDMGILEVKNVPDMIETLQSTKSIIFDMRNYPQGTMEAVSNFLKTKESGFAMYTQPDYTYPGRFTWTKSHPSGIENNANYKGKVIVLLNQESISQSEWIAMSFKTAGNTTIIGSQTAGADGNTTQFQVIKAFYTAFTGIGVYYPDRSETQRIGIIPDIEVKPTIKGIQEGRDEVLDRALLFIETGK